MSLNADALHFSNTRGGIAPSPLTHTPLICIDWMWSIGTTSIRNSVFEAQGMLSHNPFSILNFSSKVSHTNRRRRHQHAHAVLPNFSTVSWYCFNGANSYQDIATISSDRLSFTPGKLGDVRAATPNLQTVYLYSFDVVNRYRTSSLAILCSFSAAMICHHWALLSSPRFVRLYWISVRLIWIQPHNPDVAP